jgi:hypothetical protein
MEGAVDKTRLIWPSSRGSTKVSWVIGGFLNFNGQTKIG